MNQVVWFSIIPVPNPPDPDPEIDRSYVYKKNIHVQTKQNTTKNNDMLL